MSKDLWLRDVEMAEEDYGSGRIDAEEFELRMSRLGFDPIDIENMISEVEENAK